MCVNVAVDEVARPEWRGQPDCGNIKVATFLERQNVETSVGSSEASAPRIDSLTFEPYSTPMQAILALMSGTPMRVYVCSVYAIFTSFGSDYGIKSIFERNTTNGQRLVIFHELLSALFAVLSEDGNEHVNGLCPRRVDFCLDEVPSLQASVTGGTRSQQFVYFFRRDDMNAAATAAKLVSSCTDMLTAAPAGGMPLYSIAVYYWAVAQLIYGSGARTGFAKFTEKLSSAMHDEVASITDKFSIAYVDDAVHYLTVSCIEVTDSVDEDEDGVDDITYAVTATNDFLRSVTKILNYVEDVPHEEMIKVLLSDTS